ncbi:MAG TPA: hypothetical protein VGR62_23170 [Candidatus Binatia bacterium]|jgi:hypothetical protein|nr:hypothetical protein [Candidatus Binatia bacterium]
MRRIVLMLALGVSTAHALDVTTCQQVIPAGETGTLVADLDCSGLGGTDDNAVQLETRATLDLNGHTITGSPLIVTIVRAPTKGNVRVIGPGTLADGGAGVLSDKSARILVAGGVTISGCTTGIRTPRGRVVAQDVTLTDNSGDGVMAAVLDATDVTVERSGSRGLVGTQNMRLARVVSSENGLAGLVGKRIKGEDLTLDDNGSEAVFAPGGHVAATRLVATGNDLMGVLGGAIRLVDSTVTGNGDGVGVPIDIAASRPPKLLSTTCGSSAIDVGGLVDPNQTWHVCAND